MVVGIAAAVECLPVFVLCVICLLTPPPIRIFCKVHVWLVVVIGIAAVVEFALGER